MMGGPMMPSRGPLMRNRLPIGPRLPFPPRFMHPDMYRPSLPSNPRKAAICILYTLTDLHNM